jgi:nucleoside-diphosphate-sugar epimerase
VKGNLARLMAVVKRGVPLPLGAVDNRRSLIGVGNLVDMLTLCLDHPAAAGETFLAADERDVSTPELIGLLARGLGVRARLFPLPVPALRLAGRLVGRQDEVDRLCCSLQVDAAKARRLLGWSPRLSLEEGLANMTTWYLDQARV